MPNILKRTRVTRSGALLTASWIALSSVGIARAEESGATGGGQVRGAGETTTQVADVVVTAQFREQRLQDIPISITAMNAEMLAARGQTNLVQIGAQAPSVVIQPNDASGGSSAQVFIRGIGQSDVSPGLEPGVGIYIDDVYYSSMIGNVLDLGDLERVEILRGPQGTLAGKNSVGGAVKLFSKKPTGDGSGFLEGSYGSYNLVTLRGGIDLSIVPDTVFLRISAAGKRTDGYVDRLDYRCVNPTSTIAVPILVNSGGSCKIGEQGGVRQFSGRAALRIKASDRLEVNLAADITENDDQPTATKLYAAFATASFAGPVFLTGNRSYTNYSTYTVSNANPALSGSTVVSWPTTNQLSAWGVSGVVDYQLRQGVSLKSITAYRKQTGQFPIDQDNSPQAPTSVMIDTGEKQFTQEVRVNADIAEFIDATVGGFYYKGNGFYGGRAIVAPVIDIISDDAIKSINKSVFGHFVIKPVDRLNVTLGIRYSDESKEYVYHKRTPTGIFSGSVDPVNSKSNKFSAGRFDYRLGVDYRWSPGFMTYAQYSTGFKGGGVNPRASQPNQIAEFDQETVKAYEIGLKGDFFDRTVRFNAAAFYTKYYGMQLLTTTPFFNSALPVQSDPTLANYNPPGGTSPAQVIQNVGDARIKGVEAELTIRPVDGLSIDASASYVDFKYTSLLPSIMASGVTLGMTAPFMPKYKASVGVQYEISTQNGWMITPRVDWSYQSSSFADGFNRPTNKLESRSIFNARISYGSRERDWEAAVAVTNLTNEFYFYNLLDRSPTGSVSGVPSRPREWQVSIKRRF